MFTDPVGDMITRIRNAQMRKKSEVFVPLSLFKESILDALLREGYIRGYSRENQGAYPFLRVELKYFNGKPVIQEIKRVSKPSVHIYSSVKKMDSKNVGLMNTIISTSAGVLSDREARNQNVGGKILLTVR
jgi:small subunit ribosomal protein S8